MVAFAEANAIFVHFFLQRIYLNPQAQSVWRAASQPIEFTMLEKVVERLLNRFLAPYFDGISKDGLSVLKGDLRLHNLALKVDAFDFLKQLGVVLSSGRLGHLRIQIPWRHLMQAKLSIELEEFSAYFTRLGGDFPSDEKIFEDYQRWKLADVDRTLQNLQQRAEVVENAADAGAGASRMGRWMHRLAQNVHITVAGGVDIRCLDSEHRVLGGLHLGQLIVHSISSSSDEQIGSNLPVTNVLQKLCELSDLAAYVALEGASPQYALAPTCLRLSIDHRASNLSVRLDILDNDFHSRASADRTSSSWPNRGLGGNSGCGFAMSRTALYHLILILQEANAWKQYVKAVVKDSCAFVATDPAALQQSTRDEYIRLYRSKLLAGEHRALPAQDITSLTAIETAVTSTHVARWRLEVQSQVKHTRRSLWPKSWFASRQDASSQLVGEDEWRAIQMRVEEEQAHLATLETPTTIDLVFRISHLSAMVYDDGTPLRHRVESSGRRRTLHEIDEVPVVWASYEELREGLQAKEFLPLIQNKLSVTIQGVQATACISPKIVVFGESRNEWFVGARLEKVETLCDNDVLLRYVSDSQSKAFAETTAEGSHDVRLSSRVQDNGSDKVVVSVAMPPTQMHITPTALATAKRLLTFNVGQQRRGSDYDNAMEPAAEELTNFQQWTAKQKQRLRQKAQEKAMSAQDRGLIFEVDLAITAPQVSAALDDANYIHADFGKLRLVSEGVVETMLFSANLEFSDTLISCSAADDEDTTPTTYTLLEPISLSADLRSAPQDALGVEPSERGPLELEGTVTLRQLRLMMYPQAAQLAYRLANAFEQAVACDVRTTRTETDRSGVATNRSRTSTCLTPSLAPVRELSCSSISEPEPQRRSVHARVSGRVQLVRLSMYDANCREAARVDVVELGSATRTSSSEVRSSLTLQHVSMVVDGFHLLQTYPWAEATDARTSQALFLDIRRRPFVPCMEVTAKMRPVQLAWRKKVIVELVNVVRTYAPPAARTHLSLDKLSERVQSHVRAGRVRARTCAVAAEPKSAIQAGEPVPDLLRIGLRADQDLPALTSVSSTSVPTLSVDLLFGGLVVHLHRDEEEQEALCAAWRGRTCAPLLEMRVVNLHIQAERFQHEARCEFGLQTLSLMHDGVPIIVPTDDQAQIFEGELRTYMPVNRGGPLHAMCFKGLVRRISVVYFHKHLDSILHYLSEGIVSALVRQAAEEVVERTQRDLVIWNVAVESPVLHFSRDEAVLENSSAWEGRSSRSRTQCANSNAVAGDLKQYLVAYPGTIEVRNTYSDNQLSFEPPFRCLITFTECHLDMVDKLGPATGNLCAEFDWELSILVIGGVPAHLAVGLHFGEIGLSLSPPQLSLILDCVNENILYFKYFHFNIPVRKAPEGAEVSAAPAFVGRPSVMPKTGKSNVDSSGFACTLPQSLLHTEPEGVESSRCITRLEFEQVSLTLCCSPPDVKKEDPEFLPLVRLLVKEARLSVDCVMYFAGKDLVYEFGAFLNALTIEDLRPDLFRACDHIGRLLDFDSEGGFKEGPIADTWELLPDREQGKQPYLPARVDVLFVFTKISSTASAYRFELGRPRVVVLTQLARDIGVLIIQGLNSSSLLMYPGVYDQGTVAKAEKQPAQQYCTRYGVKVTQAMMLMHTNYDDERSSRIEALGSFVANVNQTGPVYVIEEGAMSDVVIRRSEPAAGPSAPDAPGGHSFSSVHLLRFSSWSVSGSYDGAQKRIAMHLNTSQVFVRLSALDGPHLFAAVSALGRDGQSMATSAEQDGICAAKKQRLPVVRDDSDGTVELCIKGAFIGNDLLRGESACSLSIIAKVGDQVDGITLAWGETVVLAVHALAGECRSTAPNLKVCGPDLELILMHHSEPVASFSFPVELCFEGFNGRQRLLPDRNGTAYSAVVGTSGDLHLEFEARYNPPQTALARMRAFADLTPPQQSLEEFLQPAPALAEFLETSVPVGLTGASLTRRQLQTERSRMPQETHALSQPTVTPIAADVSWYCEGLEASFLDDCQAKVLPVLRLSMHARGSKEEDHQKGLFFQLNPHTKEGHQKMGFVIDAKSCTIGISYLNANAGCWEPLLEQWSFDLRVRSFKTPCADGSHRSSIASGILGGSLDALTELSVISVAPVRVNITPSMCTLAGWLMDNRAAYIRHFKGEASTAGTLDFASGARYRLLNLTGVDVEVALVFPRLRNCVTDQHGLRGKSRRKLDDEVNWQQFQSCASEVPLDGLLGHTSAENWRALADEALVCFIRFVGTNTTNNVADHSLLNASPSRMESAASMPASAVATGLAQRRRSISRSRATASVLISAAGDAILPVPSPCTNWGSLRANEPAFVACEVLSPHPSHKLLMIANPLQVFNHTPREVQVRFVRMAPELEACSMDSCEAALMSLLPQTVACPPSLSAVLGKHGSTESHQDRRESRVGVAVEPTGVPSERCQYLLPGHFCAAPCSAAAGRADAVQLRLRGAQAWSEPVPLKQDSQDSVSRSPATSAVGGAETVPDPHRVVTLISETGAVLRFHAHLHLSPLSSQILNHTVSLHLTWPYQLINSTPVRLACAFEVPTKQASSGIAEEHRPIIVDAFATCDLPLSAPVFMHVGLTLHLADDRIEGSPAVSGIEGRRSCVVPDAFEAAATLEPDRCDAQLVKIPTPSLKSEGELFFRVVRGLACNIVCPRWLVDRTQLNLRVLCLEGKPTVLSVPLPRVDGHVSLLNPAEVADRTLHRKKRKPRAYYLAMTNSSGIGWSALAHVSLPAAVGAFNYASLARLPQAGQHIDLSHYPAHVCLTTDAAAAELTFGAPCHVISVLPQVVIFNELKDDDLWVRESGDAATAIRVPASDSSDFLYWQASSSSTTRATLQLQFCPVLMTQLVAWSEQIPLGGRWLRMHDIHQAAIALPPMCEHRKIPDSLRLFTVDITERGGVACVTIRRGSCFHARNYSRLIESLVIRPAGTRVVREEFVAKSCETVEFGWTRFPTQRAIHIRGNWRQSAGGGSFTFRVRDLRWPQRKVFQCPGNWQAVVVSTGFADRTTWVCVEDLLLTAALSDTGTGQEGLGEQLPPAQLKLGINLTNIGISLVSKRLQREFLYMDMRQLGFLIGIWDNQRSFDLLVSDVQIDCQAYEYCREYPVLFANRGEQEKPFMRLQLRQLLPAIRGGLSFKHVALQFDQMELSITEEIVLELCQTVCDLSGPLTSSTGGVTQQQLEEWKTRPHGGVFDAPPSAPQQVLIDELAFCGLEVKIWTSMKISVLPRPLRGAMSILTAGADELSIAGAWVCLGPELVSGVSGPLQEVGQALFFRHWAGLVMSVGRALGHSSLLDLPALPVGWARKTLWFGTNGVDFVLESASDILELCTFDTKYILQKKQEREQQLENLTSLRTGFSTATLHVAAGVWHLGDFVRQPIMGARRGGVPGFVTGIGKGIVGTVVKPAVEVGLGVRALTGAFMAKVAPPNPVARRVLTRHRPPRVMHGAGAIREYDECAALLTLEIAMAQASSISSAKDRSAVEHARFGVTDHILLKRSGAPPHTSHLLLLLTPTQLLLVDLDSTGIHVRWALAVSSLRGVRASSHGVVAWAIEEGASAFFDAAPKGVEISGDVVGHQIPCRDAAVIRSVCQLLRPLQPIAAA